MRIATKEALSLALLALLAAPARAQERPELREIFRDERVRVLVVPDVALAPEAAQAIAQRTEAAYDFAQSALGWSDDAHLARPFTIEVLTREAMRQQYPGALGVTVSTSRFLVSESYLERSATADCTIAHELTHIQDRRRLARHRTPAWLLEGRARAVGALYGKKLGLPTQREDRGEARALAQLGADDARATFASHLLRLGEPEEPFGEDEEAPRRVSIATMEQVGHLFVEFLRTRWRGGAADALERLTRVYERMARDESLPSAFEAELGAPLTDAQGAFVAMLERTSDDPHERLRGTIWGGFFQPKKPRREPTLY
jgi:hypothetical protein